MVGLERKEVMEMVEVEGKGAMSDELATEEEPCLILGNRLL